MRCWLYSLRRAQVATAHGSDIGSLLRNPELAVLLGGIQTVTLGDELAAKDRMNRGKTRKERLGPPVFDTVIEVLGQVGVQQRELPTPASV